MLRYSFKNWTKRVQHIGFATKDYSSVKTIHIKTAHKKMLLLKYCFKNIDRWGLK